MEAMDEDLGDSDDVMPPLTDSEDDDNDEDMPSFTPRVSLGEMFEQLAGDMRRPDSCPRPGFG